MKFSILAASILIGGFAVAPALAQSTPPADDEVVVTNFNSQIDQDEGNDTVNNQGDDNDNQGGDGGGGGPAGGGDSGGQGGDSQGGDNNDQ